MEKQQQVQPRAASFLQSLGLIALSALTSWGASKLTPGANTSWAPYRNQIAAGMAQIVLPIAADHVQSLIMPQQPTAAEEAESPAVVQKQNVASQ
jgi:hypothetical protein